MGSALGKLLGQPFKGNGWLGVTCSVPCGALGLVSRGAEDLQFQIKSVGGLNAQRFSKSDPKHQKVGHTKRVSAVANGTAPA